MKTPLTFLVVGGDSRQNFLAQRLDEAGGQVYTLALCPDYPRCTPVSEPSQLPFSPDVIVLPLVASNDGETVNAPFSDEKISVRRLCRDLKPGGLVVGGKLSDELISVFDELGADCADYFNREELIIENCVPTAEGALQIAIENTPVTINQSRVLILGFGRVAKATARVFSALGAKVHIAARKRQDLALAKTLGYIPLPLGSLSDSLSGFDVIINTVPAVILGREQLSRIDRETLIIDLASKPGGVDFKSGGELGLKIIWALSLPGKTAPVTSGIIIADTVLNICCERGLCDG